MLIVHRRRVCFNLNPRQFSVSGFFVLLTCNKAVAALGKAPTVQCYGAAVSKQIAVARRDGNRRGVGRVCRKLVVRKRGTPRNVCRNVFASQRTGVCYILGRSGNTAAQRDIA